MKKDYEQYKEEVLQIRTEIDFEKWFLSLGHTSSPTRSIRNEENKVPHCDTTTWISGKPKPTGYGETLWVFEYDAFNMYNKAIARLAVEMCNNMTADQIQEINIPDFIAVAKFFPKRKKENLLLILNKIKNITKSS